MVKTSFFGKSLFLATACSLSISTHNALVLETETVDKVAKIAGALSIPPAFLINAARGGLLGTLVGALGVAGVAGQLGRGGALFFAPELMVVPTASAVISGAAGGYLSYSIVHWFAHWLLDQFTPAEALMWINKEVLRAKKCKDGAERVRILQDADALLKEIDSVLRSSTKTPYSKGLERVVAGLQEQVRLVFDNVDQD